MKIIKNSLAVVALATFVVAQPAAATRSYESLPQSGIQQAVSIDRAGASVADVENLDGHPANALIILAVFGGLLALFAAAGLFGGHKAPFNLPTNTSTG